MEEDDFTTEANQLYAAALTRYALLQQRNEVTRASGDYAFRTALDVYFHTRLAREQQAQKVAAAREIARNTVPSAQTAFEVNPIA